MLIKLAYPELNATVLSFLILFVIFFRLNNGGIVINSIKAIKCGFSFLSAIPLLNIVYAISKFSYSLLIWSIVSCVVFFTCNSSFSVAYFGDLIRPISILIMVVFGFLSNDILCSDINSRKGIIHGGYYGTKSKREAIEKFLGRFSQSKNQIKIG